jgi:hypothetical protein
MEIYYLLCSLTQISNNTGKISVSFVQIRLPNKANSCV